MTKQQEISHYAGQNGYREAAAFFGINAVNNNREVYLNGKNGHQDKRNFDNKMPFRLSDNGRYYWKDGGCLGDYALGVFLRVDSNDLNVVHFIAEDGQDQSLPLAYIDAFRLQMCQLFFPLATINVAFRDGEIVFSHNGHNQQKD